LLGRHFLGGWKRKNVLGVVSGNRREMAVRNYRKGGGSSSPQKREVPMFSSGGRPIREVMVPAVVRASGRGVLTVAGGHTLRPEK